MYKEQSSRYIRTHARYCALALVIRKEERVYQWIPILEPVCTEEDSRALRKAQRRSSFDSAHYSIKFLVCTASFGDSATSKGVRLGDPGINYMDYHQH